MTNMKTLSAQDASLLAVIADNPSLSKNQKKRLIGRLSAPARAIGNAMSRESKKHGKVGAAARVAKGVREWSTSNKDAAALRLQRVLRTAED